MQVLIITKLIKGKIVKELQVGGPLDPSDSVSSELVQPESHVVVNDLMKKMFQYVDIADYYYNRSQKN